MAVSRKIGNCSTSRPSYIAHEHISKGQSIRLKEHLLDFDNVGIFHNSQKLEIILMSLNQRKDKEHVVHLNNEAIFEC